MQYHILYNIMELVMKISGEFDLRIFVKKNILVLIFVV